PPETSPPPLPEAFRELSGYYLPINHRTQMARMFVDIQSIMKFSVSDNYLHREPLFGNWKSNDYALTSDDTALIEVWSGLPTIAVVEDPLAGEVVQVSSDTYKRISAVRAFGVLGINILVLLVSALSLVCFPFWALHRLIKRIPLDASVWVRVWPLLASVFLFAVILAPTFFGSMATLGRM